MPSKYTIGNSPIGRRIRNKSNSVSGFAQVEREIGRVQSVPSLVGRSRQLPNGTLHLPPNAQAGSTAEACILGRLSVDSENSTDEATKYKINAGFLTGGGSTELIEPDNLTATIDDFVWLKVVWTANAIDGVLQAGGTMGAVTIETGTPIPDDTTPTADSTSGIAYITLGGWVSNGAEEPSPVWVNQGCGSLQLYFCPGQGFIVGRNNQVQA